jgi:hypothetical protein
MAFWLGGYAAAMIGGTKTGYPLGWLPIMGPWLNASFTTGTAQLLWAVDSVAQAGGFIVFLVGVAAGPGKLERLPLHIGPAAFAGGAQGISVSGRF